MTDSVPGVRSEITPGTLPLVSCEAHPFLYA